MWVFWTKGYYATSMDDLVKATGVARSGIYSDFGGKQETLTRCMAHYRDEVAAPAIAMLHRDDDGLKAIRAYLAYFIDMHRKHGMPGPGCFIANCVTEVAPHCVAVHDMAAGHKAQLQEGFRVALDRAARHTGGHLPAKELESLASFLSIATQGLWSYARAMDDLVELEQFATELVALVEARLATRAKANEVST